MMKEQRPLVSFILTYYNQPVQMLCECINSILALSLNEDEREIIVVDDGSEVSPMNGLMQYGDNIIYVRQHNYGVSVARNTALRMARGKYLQIIDSDDMLLQAPYEHCISIVKQHPDTEIVLFDFTHDKNHTEASFKTPLLTSGTEFLRNHNIRGAICCCLFSQSVRGDLAFTPGVAYAEDEEFTPQLLIRTEVVRYTETKAYYYRKHKASATHQHDEKSIGKRLDDTRDIIIHLNQLADRQSYNDRLAMQRRIAQLTMDYLYNIIILVGSSQELEKRISELTNQGLFPLPDRDYSQKYKWFRKMTNTRLGRAILLNTLPLIKKER